MSMKDASVVLAHGAWADGSSWAPVITALKAVSVRVSAAPLAAWPPAVKLSLPEPWGCFQRYLSMP
jgi:hypothetical protein